MTRKMIDCRAVPNEVGCTLTIGGTAEEVLDAAVAHAVTVHGHADTPELRETLRAGLADQPPAPSEPGAFVQLIEFGTDAPEAVAEIEQRWHAAIGRDRRTRWSILGADRDRPGTYLAVVEFPDHTQAMANSAHPATATWLKELQAITADEPQFRNLDVYAARTH